MFEIAYQEVNKRDEVVTKRKSSRLRLPVRSSLRRPCRKTTSSVCCLTLVDGGAKDVQCE